MEPSPSYRGTPLAFVGVLAGYRRFARLLRALRRPGPRHPRSLGVRSDGARLAEAVAAGPVRVPPDRGSELRQHRDPQRRGGAAGRRRRGRRGGLSHHDGVRGPRRWRTAAASRCPGPGHLLGRAGAGAATAPAAVRAPGQPHGRRRRPAPLHRDPPGRARPRHGSPPGARRAGGGRAWAPTGRPVPRWWFTSPSRRWRRPWSRRSPPRGWTRSLVLAARRHRPPAMPTAASTTRQSVPIVNFLTALYYLTDAMDTLDKIDQAALVPAAQAAARVIGSTRSALCGRHAAGGLVAGDPLTPPGSARC